MLPNKLANKISFKGNSVQLVGRRLALNQPAPNFVLVTKDMEEVMLAQFKKKIKVITSLVSLYAPVCNLQVKEFEQSIASFSPNVMVMVVSKDLPFAQKEYCVSNKINNLTMLSDYKYSSFGINYGLLIKELNLLARAIVILDSNDVVRYIQIGQEVAEQLDYIDVLNRLNEIIQSGPLSNTKSLPEKCVPCDAGTPPLPVSVIKHRLSSLSDWQLVENKKIVKEIKFTDFKDAKYFLDLLAIITEEQGHHPTFTLIYNKLKITLTTHVAGGLTENDFIMAKIIEELGQ